MECSAPLVKSCGGIRSLWDVSYGAIVATGWAGGSAQAKPAQRGSGAAWMNPSCTICAVITIEELRAIAEARLKDAKVLFENQRTDGAGYVCGYAIELALKARICETLNWPGFPQKRSEFENFASFKTHKLDVLLSLSGQEARIKAEHFSDWSSVASWDPEARYKMVGGADALNVALMLFSAEELLKVL